MPTKKLVRDSNSTELKGTRKKQKKESPTEVPKGAVQVTHGNAPLLTVKFLDLLLQEIRGLREDLKNG